MNESRTKNSVINFTFGAITQMINVIITFIVRTIFIKVLAKEYLGINGLFTNILTVLSFAELGIGNAIIYNMYKPVADNNKEKIKSLMKLYKKAYNTIGMVVLVTGILLIPFLRWLVKEVPNIPENINLIFFLYLVNTSLSYFITYKKSLIIAHQKEYVVNNYKVLFFIMKSILQCIVLIRYSSFLLYLIIQIMCTLLENIFVTIKAQKMFPYLKEKSVENLSKYEKTNIFSNVKSLTLYKFGSVILNGTDNIIISRLIGVVTVGIYSNYTMILSAVSSIISSALTGFTASIGNLNVMHDKKISEDTFYQLFLLTSWIFGLCSALLLLLFNPFIEIWIGRDYLLDVGTIITIVLHFFINGIQFVSYTYRITLGLFEKGKYTPVAAATINIALSIILGKMYGIAGIIFATSISRLLTTTWVDPHLIYKYEFHSPVIKYFKKYLLYFTVTSINIMICNFFVKNLGTGVVQFILRGIIIFVSSNVVYYIAYGNMPEFKRLIERMKKFVNMG